MKPVFTKSRHYKTPPALEFAVALLGVALGVWLIIANLVQPFGYLFVAAGGGALLLWFIRWRDKRKTSRGTHDRNHDPNAA